LCVAGRRDQLKFRAGGTAGNVAAILGALGWPSEVLGPAETSFGYRLLIDDLNRCGVEYHGVLSGTVPVIIEELAAPAKHRFLFDCPACGRALPRYRQVRVEHWHALRHLAAPDVFFVDRLSDDILTLARQAQDRGAFIVYEPSDPKDEPWVHAMFELAHMVKYASDRARALPWLSSAGAFEISTRGAEGLDWRWPSRGVTQWQFLRSVRTENVVDTCGAGDWLTAGILIGLLEGPPDAPREDLETTTRVLDRAQRLAAWSCGFEGARGALYADGPSAARAILNDDHRQTPHPLNDSPAFTSCVACPA
jgi:fructokinase